MSRGDGNDAGRLAATLERRAGAVASAAFGPEDRAAREAVVRMVCGFAGACMPVVVEGGRGRGFDVLYAEPAPSSLRGGRFHGRVRAIALTDGPDGPLRDVNLPGAELGDGLVHALARLAGRTTPLYRQRFSKERGIDRLAPTGGLDVKPLHQALAALVAARNASGRARLRLPYSTSLHVTEGKGQLYTAGTLLGRGPHPAAWDGRTVGPYALVAELAVGEVDWEGYASLLVRPLLPDLRAAHAAAGQAAIARFGGALDRMSLDAMRGAGSDRADLYRWLDAGGDLRARLNRRQALVSHPVLAGLTDRDDLSSAIDAGRPLAPALAGALGTGIPVVRALAGVGELGDSGVGGLLAALPDLARVEARKLPAPGREDPVAVQWKGLRDVAKGWGHLLRIHRPEHGEGQGAVAERVAAEPPLWQRKGGAARCEALMYECQDACDFVLWFGRHLLLPVAFDVIPLPADACANVIHSAASTAPPEGASAVFATLLSRHGLADIVRMSGEWHGRHGVIEASLRAGREVEALTWPALSAPFAAPGGVTVAALTDAVSLSEEGRAMSHCVGGYALTCLHEGHHIVSLRRDGERLSTAELAVSSEDGRVSLETVQHCGPGNDVPVPDAVRALEAYVAAAGTGEVAVDAVALEEARLSRVGAAGTGGAVRYVGYDHADARLRDMAMSLYAFALPPGERGMTHAEWVEAHGLRETMASAVRRIAGGYRDAAMLREASAPEDWKAFEAWRREGEVTASPSPSP